MSRYKEAVITEEMKALSSVIRLLSDKYASLFTARNGKRSILSLDCRHGSVFIVDKLDATEIHALIES